MDINALIDECALDVHPKTMMAIIQTESAARPWVINVNGKPATITFSQPKSYSEAINLVNRIDDQVNSIDVGLTQINSKNLKAWGVDYETAFDPCTNIKLGAALITRLYESAAQKFGAGQKALHKAISAYNTGSFERGFANGYVNKVLKHAGVKKKKPAAHSSRHIVTYDKSLIDRILNSSSLEK